MIGLHRGCSNHPILLISSLIPSPYPGRAWQRGRASRAHVASQFPTGRGRRSRALPLRAHHRPRYSDSPPPPRSSHQTRASPHSLLGSASPLICSRRYRGGVKGGRGCQCALRQAVAAPWRHRAPRSLWGGWLGYAGRPRGEAGALIMVMESAPAICCFQWERGGGGERGRPLLEAVVARGRDCETQSTGGEGGAAGGGEVRKGGMARWPCRRQD